MGTGGSREGCTFLIEPAGSMEVRHSSVAAIGGRQITFSQRQVVRSDRDSVRSLDRDMFVISQSGSPDSRRGQHPHRHVLIERYECTTASGCQRRHVEIGQLARTVHVLSRWIWRSAGRAGSSTRSCPESGTLFTAKRPLGKGTVECPFPLCREWPAGGPTPAAGPQDPEWALQGGTNWTVL